MLNSMYQELGDVLFGTINASQRPISPLSPDHGSIVGLERSSKGYQ